MNTLSRKSWSPYVVGVAIGVLSWLAFALADHPLGITTAFESTAALLEAQTLPPAAGTDEFMAAKAKEGKPPRIDWEWALVVGVFLGALVSARLSGDRATETVPRLWRYRFGSSLAKRYTGAFFGAAIMMFGARVAQGCTSGHGISGALQLAVSSWLFVVVFFLAGIATAFLVYGRGGPRHV